MTQSHLNKNINKIIIVTMYTVVQFADKTNLKNMMQFNNQISQLSKFQYSLVNINYIIYPHIERQLYKFFNIETNRMSQLSESNMAMNTNQVYFNHGG